MDEIRNAAKGARVENSCLTEEKKEGLSVVVAQSIVVEAGRIDLFSHGRPICSGLPASLGVTCSRTTT